MLYNYVCVIFCFTTKWIGYTYTYIPISPPSCVSLPPSLPHPSRWSQSTKPISFMWKYLVSPSFLDIELWVDSSVLSELEKRHGSSSGLQGFLSEICYHSNCFSPLGEMSFHSCCFKIFFFSLTFRIWLWCI